MSLNKVFLLSFLLINIISCTTPTVRTVEKTKSNNISLKIETSPSQYAPFMSSTVGILIKPIYEENKDNKVTLKTDKGIFLSWNNDGDSKVKTLGKETIYDGKNVYWSYDTSEKFTDNDVKVSITNQKTDEIVKETIVKIKIDEKGLASVINNNTENNSNTKTQELSFKGYELYTWKEDKIQVFALLLGTNRNKTADEIKKAKIDFDTLISEISQFAKGEYLTLVFAGMHQSLPPAELNEEMKQKLKALCNEKGINLSLG
ncbi:MAG: hypothetical protein ACK4IX_06250 [Candidatus Sericytochromatia bacterium]